MGIMLDVGNLSAGVTDIDLYVRFGDYGMVESAIVSPDPLAIFGEQRARVAMANDEEAQAAIDWLHDTQFKGRKISVSRAPDVARRTIWFHLDIPR